MRSFLGTDDCRYNVITRGIESELIPALRHANIRLVVYNPLAGGLLSGKHSLADGPQAGRFKDNPMYLNRFWNDTYFASIDAAKAACEAEGISLAAAALRWLVHHSMLSGKCGDAVIIGASSAAHLEANLVACADGPLPETLLKALDEAEAVARPACPVYHRGYSNSSNK